MTKSKEQAPKYDIKKAGKRTKPSVTVGGGVIKKANLTIIKKGTIETDYSITGNQKKKKDK